MKKLLLLFLLFALYTEAQEFRVMSYNVENLFDTRDGPLSGDDEFLPSGTRRWTNGRYYHKLQQIAKVINAAGNWDTPALIGLCEIENDSTLIHLLNRTPLRNQQYRYCIGHSSDTRGIHVALLYQRDKFKYLSHTSIPIRFTKDKEKTTRDILHVSGQFVSGDTLDVFVCHFPSRYGGEKESRVYRFDAARTLRSVCDSIHRERKSAYILIMGDLNDTPDDASITEVLGVKALSGNIHNMERSGDLHLINLFATPISSLPEIKGSHKYQGEWNQLDHIIISSNMLGLSGTIRLVPESNRLFTPSFLFTKDKTHRGVRPKRSYYGFKYEGGFSDHLPLIIDLVIDSRRSD